MGKIVYDKLLLLMEQRGLTTYRIRKEKIISESTLQNIRVGKRITTDAIASLCAALNCQPGDIIEYAEENRMNVYEKIEKAHTALSALRPFEGSMLEQLKDYFKIGLTWSSNALEGNTLTINETKLLLEEGLTVGGKPLRDTLEAVGHGEAYDFMFTLIGNELIGMDDMKGLHRLFYRGIDEANAGVWREHSVIVTGTNYVFPAPQEIEPQMQELCHWISAERSKMHPVKFAAMLHLKLVTVHPFTDGNGRTARLLMNLALIQKGYQLVIIPPICRVEYNDLIRVYQNKGNAEPFCSFIAERVYETQKEIMRLFHINTNHL